jgi:two-component system response regulator (stage 0 sporulation protein F)
MTSPRVLVVDNRASDRLVVRECLEHEGYTVFEAPTSTEAERLLAGEQIDLCVIDLRLVSDVDEKDVSGIALARRIDPKIPKIIWTSFPTYTAVRKALGPNHNGIPPAVGFVSKQDDEGLPALLSAVKLALTPANGVFAKRVLQAFEVDAPVALHHRIKEVGLDKTSALMRKALLDVSAESVRRRRVEEVRASQLHATGLVASWLGLTLILVTGALILLHSVEGSVLSLFATLIVAVIRKLFSSREDAAHKRVRQSYAELESVGRAVNMLAICDSLESVKARDAYRKKLLDHMIDEKWLLGPPNQ